MAISNHRRSTSSRLRYIGYRGNGGRRWIRIRYKSILRRWNWISYRVVLSMRVGIDACGGGCVRLRYNMSRRIGRDSSVNCWVGCRVKNGRAIDRDSSGCCKK